MPIAPPMRFERAEDPNTLPTRLNADFAKYVPGGEDDLSDFMNAWTKIPPHITEQKEKRKWLEEYRKKLYKDILARMASEGWTHLSVDPAGVNAAFGASARHQLKQTTDGQLSEAGYSGEDIKIIREMVRQGDAYTETLKKGPLASIQTKEGRQATASPGAFAQQLGRGAGQAFGPQSPVGQMVQGAGRFAAAPFQRTAQNIGQGMQQGLGTMGSNLASAGQRLGQMPPEAMQAGGQTMQEGNTGWVRDTILGMTDKLINLVKGTPNQVDLPQMKEQEETMTMQGGQMKPLQQDIGNQPLRLKTRPMVKR